MSDFEQRAFGLEAVPFEGRTINLLSLEADYTSDERIVPADWRARVSHEIDSADLTVVEYFVPELEQNIPRFHRLGWYSRNIASVYGDIADMAHAQGKDVAVADIANRPLYQAYNIGILPAVGLAALACAKRGGLLGWAGFAAGEAYVAGMTYQSARQTGTYGVQPSKSEQYTVSLNDARRSLTAQGLAKLARQQPPESNLLYVAAPAHTARVKRMLESPSPADGVKRSFYRRLAGLDREVRIYSPAEDGWSRRP